MGDGSRRYHTLNRWLRCCPAFSGKPVLGQAGRLRHVRPARKLSAFDVRGVPKPESAIPREAPHRTELPLCGKSGTDGGDAVLLASPHWRAAEGRAPAPLPRLRRMTRTTVGTSEQTNLSEKGSHRLRVEITKVNEATGNVNTFQFLFKLGPSRRALKRVMNMSQKHSWYHAVEAHSNPASTHSGPRF